MKLGLKKMIPCLPPFCNRQAEDDGEHVLLYLGQSEEVMTAMKLDNFARLRQED